MFRVEFIEASNLVGKERAVGVLHSSACQTALESYRQNVWRHTAFLGLPGYVSLMAHNWATANYAAQMELKITALTPEHAARADQLMNGLAAVNNQSIDALSLTRNLLVHKSGLIDEKFQKECVGIPLLVPFGSLALGDAIRIDGKTVVAMVDPTLESGYSMIELVDSWLWARRANP